MIEVALTGLFFGALTTGFCCVWDNAAPPVSGIGMACAIAVLVVFVGYIPEVAESATVRLGYAPHFLRVIGGLCFVGGIAAALMTVLALPPLRRYAQ